MRFWFFHKYDRGYPEEEDQRTFLKQDLMADYTRGASMEGSGDFIRWNISAGPFILQELKVRKRL